MIGKQIGGRYEILETIGGGGMAIVYKARDILLNRKVAVKILREQFVHDEDFIQRFRREAQSAASLSHPNVVSIYDVGKEDDIHYIVMEYIAGSNLNEEIKRRAPFQTDEVLRIVAQICDALDHAHQNHIIHRDIKPHNIILGKNGRVKVTDFGIARAATSTDITQTGAVIGSVHYLSPEHAKGITQGEKSDIYSLGIVMYQMLTRQLPFTGDSPISIALKHLQEPVEPPRQHNALIPHEVEAVILKALQKQPEERYQSAKDMLDDIEAILEGERYDTKPQRFPIVNEAVDDDDEQPTIIMPALKEEEYGNEEATRIMPAIGELQQTKIRTHTSDQVDGTDERKRLLRRILIKASVWLLIAVIVAGGGWYGVNALKEVLIVPDIPVPDVTGLTFDEAEDILVERGLKADPVYEFSNEVAKDYVIRQESSPTVKKDSPVTLYVSNGVNYETMPSAEDKSWDEIVAALEELGVTPDRIKKNEMVDDAPAETILEQTPEAGEQFDPRTQIITFTVSQGKAQIQTPNVIHLKQNVARSLLIQAGFEPEVMEEYSFTVPEGYVIRQWPAEPGSLVKPGSEILYFVSIGFPDDALAPVKFIEAEPPVEGEPAVIKIEVLDARGFVTETKVIHEKETIPVSVIVSNNHNAVIDYSINGSFKDSFTITRKNAVDQNAPKPAPITEQQFLRNNAEGAAMNE